jgi:hypothetical protein
LVRVWRVGWSPGSLVAISALILFPYAPSSIMGVQIPFGAAALAVTFAVLYRRYLKETASLARSFVSPAIIPAYA